MLLFSKQIKSLFVADFSDKVGKGLSKLFGIGKVDALVGGVGVGLGSDETESKDEGVWVHAVELGKEGNRATHTVGTSVFSIKEVAACFLDAAFEPFGLVFHAPALASVATLDGDLSIVGDVSGQDLDEFGLCLGGLGGGWESHRKLD